MPDRFDRAKEPEIDSLRRQQRGSTYDELRNFDLYLMRKYPTQAQTLWLLPFIYKLGDGWENLSVSAFDISGGTNSLDTELFLHAKKRYFKAKGRFGRFLSPQSLDTVDAKFVRSLQLTYNYM